MRSSALPPRRRRRFLGATLVARIALAAWLALLATTPARAAELRIALSADVTSIDPHAVNIAPNNAVGWHVFEALTHVDAQARLVPGLAESWRAVDPTTWEFRLRRGVKFHDGTDLTAEDVVFSIDRARSLPAGQFAPFVQRIVEAKAADPLTVRIRTASPYAMVPYDLNSVFVVSRRAAAGAASEDFNTGKAAIGTGPFRLVRFARGDRVELARNDAWWGSRTAWDKVTLRIVASDPARIAALLANDVDLIENIPTADLARLARDARFTLARTTSWRTLLFHLDQSRDAPPFMTDKAGAPLTRNPFKDPRVRLAVSKAMQRQAIVERVMEGAAVPAANLVAPTVFGHVASLVPEAHDLAGAKKLMAEAGWPDGFALTLHAPNNRYVNDDQVAQAAAQMLARIGITTRIETMPANVYFTRARKGEFAFALLGWGSFSADLALRTLVATPDAKKGMGAWNWSGYSNPRVDALVEQALATTDDARRETAAKEAMTLAMRDVAVVPLHHQIVTWAMKRGLAYTPRTDEFTLAKDVVPRQ
jgi:peptide/nickel transport system substrate-binding protein